MLIIIPFLFTLLITSLNCEQAKNAENKNEKSTFEKLWQYGFKGFASAAFKNAAQYTIKFGGRKSNIVNVYDKTVKSSLGNPKWFARVDAPHGNVPFHHINVNKGVTGVKDPHTPISETMAKAAGEVGKVLDHINQAAPAFMAISVASDVYEFACEAKKDYDNESTRNTVQKAATTAATTGGSLAGSTAGAAIGTAIFPGVGTLVGSLVGGACGGVGGGMGGEAVSDALFDVFGYGIDDIKCEKCGKHFRHRRYQEGPHQKLCPKCR